jgi:LEA14-like dessication related protein
MRRLLLFLFLFGLSACATLPPGVQAPRVSLADVSLRSLGLLEQRFELDLDLVNPNDFDLKIEGLDFELEVNGRPFANGISRVTTLLPAGATTPIRVDAITRSKDWLTQMKALSPDVLKAGVPYRVHGRVKAGGLSRWLPFEHTGVYGGGTKRPKGQAI